MKIIILDYSDGKIYFGDVEDGQIEEYEKWLIEREFCLDEIEWMVVDNLRIESI